MSILVLGGAGYIGSHTIMSDNMQARELKNDGNYIRVENDREKINSQELFYDRAYEQAKNAELIGGK